MLTKFIYARADDTYAEEVMTVLAARLPTDSDLDWKRMAATAARGACKFVLTDDGVGLCEGIIIERLEALLEIAPPGQLTFDSGRFSEDHVTLDTQVLESRVSESEGCASS